jgi:RNA polymerase sigma factor (sigma-70 family)
MKNLNDIELLDAYASQRSEEAFRELVARHVDFTYSAAMRQLRNPHLAEEATQSAFIALAGKAGQLSRKTVVVGWLYRAVHFAALNMQRSEARRKHWEEEAATVNIPAHDDQPFHELALPQVDGALAELSESDRDAVILRFLQQRSFRDLAETLGISEEAAKKRVSRGLEKLRGLLARRGVVISAAALAAGLSQMPVTAAPAAFSAALAVLAASTAAPTVSTIATILNLMKSTKAKLAVAVSLVILIGGALLLWQFSLGNSSVASPGLESSSVPRINVTSVLVDDQDKALQFYTGVLGFVTKWDVPTGEPGGARWLTVVSPDETNGTELLLEPIGFAPARTYQKELFEAGKPWATLSTEDVQKQFERLKNQGVKFSIEPTTAGATTTAAFEDPCGNRIQIVQTPVADNARATSSLKIKLSRVLVEDQDKALKFYTEVLGFVKKREMPGRGWTVASPAGPNGSELLLEPSGTEPARTFQQAVRKAGIPLTQFAVEDVHKAYERLTRLGVKFQGAPMQMGPVTFAMFDDTCGNLIQLIQE